MYFKWRSWLYVSFLSDHAAHPGGARLFEERRPRLAAPRLAASWLAASRLAVSRLAMPRLAASRLAAYRLAASRLAASRLASFLFQPLIVSSSRSSSVFFLSSSLERSHLSVSLPPHHFILLGEADSLWNLLKCIRAVEKAAL